MRFDQSVFLGVTPWLVTHGIFSDPISTWILMQYYHVTFVLFWASLGFVIVNRNLEWLRVQYCLTTMLSFIIIGNIAALLLSSAGPCYYHWVVGSPGPYDGLIARLRSQDLELMNISPYLHLYSLDAQEYLRESLGSKALVRGGGISAMPSMHVSAATLAMLAGWQINKTLGPALGVGVLVTWIGSVHLGWHYAVDGIVSFLMTLLIWAFTSQLTSRLCRSL